MEIEVIDTAKGPQFCFETQDSSGNLLHFTSNALYPPQHCRGEVIKIYRNGEKKAEGRINWVGTHSSAPRFCAIDHNERYKAKLRARDFDLGDTIVIEEAATESPVRAFDRNYWACMLPLGIEPPIYKV